MRILHYILGFPPERTGGMTKYATDLIRVQKKNNKVFVLFPGGYIHLRRKCWVSFAYTREQVICYKINNPCVIPLLYGIKRPDKVFHTIDESVVINFYNSVKPDVIHVHTLMGLPKAFISVAKKMHIRIVYTSHDYFGICLRVNFVNDRGKVCETPNPYLCSICNSSAPKTLFLKLRNMPTLLKYKNVFPSKLKYNSHSISCTSALVQTNTTPHNLNSYGKLLDTYITMLEQFDIIHFNSTVAKEVYESHLKINKSVVLPITHQGIMDRRKILHVDGSCIKIGFIGSIAPYKGFPLLKNILRDLSSQGYNNWLLSVWGGPKGTDKECNNIVYKGKFTARQLEQVYQSMDLLIVPSIWKETFSLITLEALSFGVPVIVSKNVGAKDIVSQYDPHFVFDSSESLKELIFQILLDQEILKEFNKNILDQPWKHSVEIHAQIIKKELYL